MAIYARGRVEVIKVERGVLTRKVAMWIRRMRLLKTLSVEKYYLTLIIIPKLLIM